MAMAGRKRKQGIRRKPNGQPLYSERIEPTEEMKAQRIAAFGDWKVRGELNCPADRLKASLSEEQYWAAKIARQTYSRYLAAIHAPRCVSGQLEDYVESGSAGEPMDADSAQQAVKRYTDLITAIRLYSFRGLKEIERLMDGRKHRDLDHLKLGLEAICGYLNLRERKAA
jgi:hypothetical protein